MVTATKKALNSIVEKRQTVAGAPKSSDRTGLSNIVWLWIVSRCWSGASFDALALFKPSHDGTPQELAREVYHRLQARFAAQAMWEREWLILFASFLFSTVWLAILAAGPDAAKALSFIGIPFLLAWFAGLFFPQIFFFGIYKKEHREEAVGIVKRSFLRAVDVNAPDDLQDPWVHGWLTSEGRPLSAEIAASDAEKVVTDTRTGYFLLAYLALGMALFLPFVAVAFIPALAVIRLIFDLSPLTERMKELKQAEAVEGVTFASAGGIEWGRQAERARAEQIAEALRSDDRKVVSFGKATGILGARGDFFASSEALPFCLSLRDLQTHLLVLGGTGSGKTSGVLRPLAVQVADWPDVGMLVMDGKGSLPKELEGLAGMTLLDPANQDVRVSLVDGVDPSQIAATILDILGGGTSDRFWSDSAMTLVRHSASLARASEMLTGKHEGDRMWSLEGIKRACLEPLVRKDLLSAFDASHRAQDPDLDVAIRFFDGEWTDDPDNRTNASIKATARSWFEAILSHGDLRRWASVRPSQATVKITDVLKGGRFGLLVPSYRYGDGAALVTALLKSQLYAEIKKRAESDKLAPGETPVFFLIDEAQEVATREDAVMLTIGRSLELAVVGATQTVEGVHEKLGQSAQKWLATFGNVIALPSRSRHTEDYVSERIGVSWRPSVTQAQGLPIRTSIQATALSGVNGAAPRQLHVRQHGGITDAPGGLMKTIQKGMARLFGQEPDIQRQSASMIGPSPIIAPSETSSLLAEPNTALAACVRARVPRRDVIRLNPIYGKVSSPSEPEME